MMNRLHENHIQPPSMPNAASFAETAEAWKDQAGDMAQDVKSQLEDAGKMIHQYVQHQPARALGIALALGVCLGWLMKRR